MERFIAGIRENKVFHMDWGIEIATKLFCHMKERDTLKMVKGDN